MKNIFLTIVCTVIILHAQAQVQMNYTVVINFKTDTIKTQHYQFEELNKEYKRMVIHTTFNEVDFEDIAKLEKLCSGSINIVSIDYVFTRNHNKKMQDKLNSRRIFELFLHAPQILSQGMTRWRFIEQTEHSKKGTPKILLHGFVIVYNEIPPYYSASVKQVKDDIKRRMEKPYDSVITKVFSRNKDFNQEVVVADLTGSMSPYYLEVMAWICLHHYKDKVGFTFFNDGDNKPSESKYIGNTGGLYSFKSNSLDSIANFVYRTIQGGDGGDSPENDIEAILKAIDLNPQAKEIILIADNWSDMRDFGLRFRITKPVRIVLCGTHSGINPQYLNLAMITKGSVHTMDEDLKNLFELANGKTFKIKGETFIVLNGKIEKLTKS